MINAIFLRSLSYKNVVKLPNKSCFSLRPLVSPTLKKPCFRMQLLCDFMLQQEQRQVQPVVCVIWQLQPLARISYCPRTLRTLRTSDPPNLRPSFVRLPVNLECASHCLPPPPNTHPPPRRSASHLALSTSAHLVIARKCSRLQAGRETVHTSGPKTFSAACSPTAFFISFLDEKKLQCKQQIKHE